MPRSDRSTSWVLGCGWSLASSRVVTLVRSWQVGIPLRDPHGTILGTAPLIRGHLRRARRHRRVARTPRPPEPRAVVTTVAPAVDVAPAAARGGGAAGLPRRLLLLPQPEELGRPQLPPRRPCCPPGTSGSSSATARRCCCTTCSASTSRRTSCWWSTSRSPPWCLCVVAAWCSPIDPRRLRLHRVRRCGCGSSASASYYAIPSLGPVPLGAADFAGLPHTVIQDTQARYMAQRAHLLAHPHGATPSPRCRRSPACTSP